MTREGGPETSTEPEILLIRLGGDPSAPKPSAPPETAPETTLETVSRAYPASDKGIRAISAPRQRETQSLRPHLPRFHRAKRSHRPPLALQDRDLELLRTVHSYRLISTPQFLRLFSDESRDGIYRRLQKLFHHGYLDRLGENPNAPLVYQLARRGAEVLEVVHRKEPGERYLAHQLMIGDFRIAMTLATRVRGIDLTWRVPPADQSVRPDGFFGLQFPNRPDGKNRAFFFLEADRSTMTRERFVEKLASYCQWYRAGGHTEKLGIKGFRVLTVTKSAERLRSLLGATASASDLVDALRMFWFTAQDRFSAEQATRVIEPIWHVVGESGGPLGLVPTS